MWSDSLISATLTAGRDCLRTYVSALALPFSNSRAYSKPSIIPENKSISLKLFSISSIVNEDLKCSSDI